MTVIARLLQAREPVMRYKILIGVLNSSPDSAGVADVREAVRRSQRVQRPLAERANHPWVGVSQARDR